MHVRVSMGRRPRTCRLSPPPPLAPPCPPPAPPPRRAARPPPPSPAQPPALQWSSRRTEARSSTRLQPRLQPRPCARAVQRWRAGPRRSLDRHWPLPPLPTAAAAALAGGAGGNVASCIPADVVAAAAAGRGSSPGTGGWASSEARGRRGSLTVKGGGLGDFGGSSREPPRQWLGAQWLGLILGVPSCPEPPGAP